MTEREFLKTELYSRFGNVKRARNCFLYTEKGVRLTDLYQENGRAILGWGGSSAFTQFKNILNRGITGSFETGFNNRLTKAVESLFNSPRKVFIFNSYEKALKTSILFSKEDTNVFRPWNNSNINWAERTSIVFAPPLPWASEIFIVAVKKESVESKECKECKESFLKDLENLLPQSEVLPAPLLAAVIRSVYDLISALKERSEKDWFLYDTVLHNYWERKGPYLFSKVPDNLYKDFFLHCLNCNLVINPEKNMPSIVPYGADKGVFTALKNNPFKMD